MCKYVFCQPRKNPQWDLTGWHKKTLQFQDLCPIHAEDLLSEPALVVTSRSGEINSCHAALSVAWRGVLVSLLGAGVHVELLSREQAEEIRFTLIKEVIKNLEHYYILFLDHYQEPSGSALYSCFCPRHWSVQPALHLGSNPSLPNCCVFLLTFHCCFTWRHVSTRRFLILIMKILFSEKWAYF